MHILLIEDETRIADFVQRGLEEHGHRVDIARGLSEGRELLALRDPELLVVDRGLPDGDGLALVRQLRAEGDHRPAVVLTARDALDDRVEGLHGGADDYLTKPFAFSELLARIEAVARRTVLASPRLTVGPLEIDLASLRVFAGEVEIHLTAQEFKLLRYLAEQGGRIVSRTMLLEHVWGMHHDPGSNVVDVYVSYLRQKLSAAQLPPLLHTVRGRGWVLEARG